MWGERLPKQCLICYQPTITRHLNSRFKSEVQRITAATLWGAKGFFTKELCFVEMTGVGAPHAAAMLEELIALGLQEFLSIGAAGGLMTGGFFVCEKALCDEGVALHYAPDQEFAYPDPELTEALAQAFKAQALPFTLAPSWSTAALYRETDLEAIRYRAKGIATVEMEAAALFTIAQLRKVKLASAFTVSDILNSDSAQTDWKNIHRSDPQRARRELTQLADTAVLCLCNRVLSVY